MEVRRKFITECKGQPKLQKALALALYMKHCFGRSAMLKNYSINKIHNVTGISATTIKKYLPILVEYGWIDFVGKENEHLIVCKLASHTAGRNIKVDKFCFKSFLDVLRSLRAFIALLIQAHKDFVKRTIQIATNPKKGQNFKGARKLMKRLVRQGAIRSIYDKYNEFGISLKRFAKEIGCCAKTAQSIMNYAVDKKWVKKTHHYERVFSPDYQISGSFFYKKGFSYRVYANTYELSNPLSKVLLLCGK